MAITSSKREWTTENDLSKDQDYKLWVLLSQTMEAMLKSRRIELVPYHISSSQARALFIILSLGNKATPAEISRRLFRETHTVSELLNRMEKDGLVKKVKDLNRRNMVRAVVTEKGREAYSHSTKMASIHKIMSLLSEVERQQLWSSLPKLRNEALKDIGIRQKLSSPSTE